MYVCTLVMALPLGEEYATYVYLLFTFLYFFFSEGQNVALVFTYTVGDILVVKGLKGFVSVGAHAGL